MKQIIFSTGNKSKLAEAIQACEPYGIEVTQTKLDIDEIQSHDPLIISKHKAETAFSLVAKPIVINDSFWEIPALGGFPGGYMKDVNEWFTAEDFIDLMSRKTDRRICLTECVIYKDSEITKVIKKQFWGEVALEPRGIGNALEQIAVFDGLSIGEYHAQNKYVFDPEDYVWEDFAKWFAAQK